MTRNLRWIAVLALTVALAACGEATEGASSSGDAPDSTTVVQTEVVPPTVDASTVEREANSVVEDTATASGTVKAPNPTTPTTEGGSAPTTNTTVDPSIASSAGSLDQSTVDGLRWMREEEKLARDVYLALSEVWDLAIFANIAESEQAHTDAVGGLLDQYGIPDPMAVDVPGVFADPTIQKLYDDLVAQGSQSLTDALTVGATIEDMDIVDLQLRKTGVETVDTVYANLEKGSRNHLRAFVRNLDRQGGEYIPTYLTAAAYEAIISSPTERGRAGG